MSHILTIALLVTSTLQAPTGSNGAFSHAVTHKEGRNTYLGNARLASQGLVTVHEDQGFWFSNFAVGGSQSLEMVIDTGTSDVIVNPSVYKPGPQSKNTNQSFQAGFLTDESELGGGVVEGTIYQDLVQSVEEPNLAVKAQSIGVINQAAKPLFPHDGLVGLGGRAGSSLNQSTFLDNLCGQKSLPECRFGLALGQDGKGHITYGTVDKSLFDGDLTIVPLLQGSFSGGWAFAADVVANGTVTKSGEQILTDTAISGVYGPIDEARAIFQAAGLTVTENKNSTGDVVTIDGHYDCNSPPQIGFGFSGTVFALTPEALAQKNENGQCTASMHGHTDFRGWIAGTSFLRGYYVDHNVDGKSMGFAKLK